MSGGKGNANTTSTVRFAPYLEAAHQDFLNMFISKRNIALAQSPFVSYTDLDIEAAFFGSGFVLSSFPSLYDMYGKFMAGLDIEVLFDQSMSETIDGAVVHNLVSAQADMLSDDIEIEAAPRFETGMRDINSVISSSFVVGRSLMEVARTKAISRYSAELQGKLLPVAISRWEAHLGWNRSVVETYAQILKFYISAEMDVTGHNMEIHAKDALWPFTILEYERAAIGVLNGATNTHTEVAGASKAAKVIGGTLMGASAGALTGAEIGGSVMGLPGAAFGAIVGGILGLAGGLVS